MKKILPYSSIKAHHGKYVKGIKCGDHQIICECGETAHFDLNFRKGKGSVKCRPCGRVFHMDHEHGKGDEITSPHEVHEKPKEEGPPNPGPGLVDEPGDEPAVNPGEDTVDIE